MPDGAAKLPALGESGCVVTVGTFDGVHRGHAHLLRTVLRAAHERRTQSVLVTFHPHPLKVVRPEVAPPLLTTPREKVEVLAASGLDAVALIGFDTGIADYPPRRFVEELLLHRLGMGHLVVGYDHAFGRNRSGNVDTLRALGRELGFGVEIVEPLRGPEGPISSTRIRAALQAGDVLAAAESLGRPYTLVGTVVPGDGRGHDLGFPTANLALPLADKLVPRDGIYAVRAAAAGMLLDGVLHVGPRPTFPGASASVELHLFEFSESLYGRSVRVDFCARIRDIEAFDDVATLVRAMERDCAAARAVLNASAGACGLSPEPLT